MRNNLHVTFKDGHASDHIINHIEKHYDKLRRKNRNIINCRVIIDRPHYKHGGAEKYSVTVHLNTPGQDLVGHSKNGEGELFVSIAEAFRTVASQMIGRSKTSRLGTQARNFARNYGRSIILDPQPSFN